MKPFRIIKTTVIIFLLTFTVVLNSCKKTVINEVKVTDFATLKSQFSNPPAEYTTAPFFAWNANITNDEIDKDLVGFKNAGSSQTNSIGRSDHIPRKFKPERKCNWISENQRDKCI